MRSSSSSVSELECKAFGESDDKDIKVLVPPLPLHQLLAADKDVSGSRFSAGEYRPRHVLSYKLSRAPSKSDTAVLRVQWNASPCEN